MEHQKNKESRLAEFSQNPEKALWKLAVPMMFGMFVQSIYMLTDTAYIGNWVGHEGLAALGYVWPYMFIIMGITFGLGSGATAVIAKYIGEKNKDDADKAAGQTLFIGIFISLLIICIIFLLKENIFRIQNAEDDIIEISLIYFRIVGGGSFLMILGMFFRAILSGEGDNMFPMKVLGIGTVLNMILDPPFIYYKGVEGAALATIFSQTIVLLIFIFYMAYKKTSYIHLSIKNLKPDFKIISKILKIGIPSSLSMIIMACGAFVFNYILDSTDAVAAFQTAGRIENLFFLPIISISSSLVTLVGMFYGAKKYNLINRITKYGIYSGLAISLISCAFFFFLADYIVPLFIRADNGELVRKITIQYFSICCFTYPFVTIGMTSSRVMQGLGHGIPVLVLTLLRVCLISAPLSWICINILNLPLEYVWYSILLSSIITSFTGLLWMKKVVKMIAA